MGVKFGMEEGTEGPLLHAKFHPHRCNVSPLQGEKPQIGLFLSKYRQVCAARNAAGKNSTFLAAAAADEIRAPPNLAW